MRAAIYTLGCRLNQAESAILAGRLAEAGYELVSFNKEADVGIVHSCTVTNEADVKTRKAIRAFLRRNPDAFLAVIGCYAEVNGATLATIEGVDLIVGTAGKLDIVPDLEIKKRRTPRLLYATFEPGPFRHDVTPCIATATRANIKIQEGCDGHCAYCIVPRARGPARSRELGDLVAEAEGRVALGAKELVITGVDTAAYAYEDATLVDVADRLAAIEGVVRLRVSSVESATFPEALFERMAAPDHPLVPFLHLPLQSGSDGVLERMGRRYGTSDFRALVEKAHAAVPDICIGTDVIVGLPSESEEDFEATVALVKDTPIAYAHVFKYSIRPGTAAAAFPVHHDPVTIRNRAEHMRHVADTCWRTFRERFLGRRFEVLFETGADGLWQGYTPNYMRVAASCRRRLSNQLRRVELMKVEGELVRGVIEDDHEHSA